VLTSIRNPKVAAAARLKKRAFREQDRRFLVEGGQGVAEALREPARLEALFVADDVDPLGVRAREAGLPVHHVSDELMHSLTSTVTPQGVLATAPFLDVGLDGLPGEGCVVLLHEVRDPGNAGTVLRSADAAGAGGVVFTESSVDPYNPKSVRASAGSIFHLPVVRGASTPAAVSYLRSTGFRVVAMDAHGDADLYRADLGSPVAFLFGNEAHGLPREVLDLADGSVRVPHAGRAESLNLAAAASVCLFEWMRRRVRVDETLETLIAAAAHDIRSPLTAMKGFGYALERRYGEMTAAQRDMMLRGIVHDADRTDTILRQLVDAARIVAGSLELFREQIDLSDLVGDVAEGQRRDPEHPEIEWAGDPGPFLVDPARMKTTILAFAESLVWWGDEGPIVVHAERRGARLHVWASRAGSQLDGPAADALFAPRRPGTGGGSKIGLYVARGVAEAQGGRTWAEAGGGTLSFHLELPLPS
jgi:RNA methyltransferase, TrmH family